jgi:Family of unknown function (DUF6312)
MATTVTTVPATDRRKYPARSVTRVTISSDGSVHRTELSAKKKRKKIDRRYRPIEKRLRKLTKAQRVSVDEYDRRHKRSRQKKKNGPIRDLSKNVRKAHRKGVKKLK